MRRRNSRGKGLLLIILLLAAALGVVVIKLRGPKETEEPRDPHEGQVLVNDGFNDVWITPIEGLEVSSLKKEDFVTVDGKVVYTGDAYDTVLGVDVAEHQWEIDWKQVADAGVKLAYIRSGYRGWSQGGLYEDPWFRRNMEEAAKAGLDVGVYFYSQAINVAEAIEEAKYVLGQVEGYQIALPIMYDWEIPEGAPEARTNGLDPSIIGDCGVAFCETIRAAGYEAGIYFTRQLGYYSIDLEGRRIFFVDSACGDVSQEQLDWLEREVPKVDDEVLLFMHHPPCFCNHRFMDLRYHLKNMVEVQQVFSKFNNLKHIFCGHYHFNFEVKMGQQVVHAAPSTQMQIDPESPYFRLRSSAPGWVTINWGENFVDTEVHF